jgi:hypothetical protein
MLCDEVRPQTSTKQALNRLPREVTLDIDTLAFAAIGNAGPLLVVV